MITYTFFLAPRLQLGSERKGSGDNDNLYYFPLYFPKGAPDGKQANTQSHRQRLFSTQDR